MILIGPHYLMVFIQGVPKEIQVEMTEVLTVPCNFVLTAVFVSKEWKIVNVKNGTTNLET